MAEDKFTNLENDETNVHNLLEEPTTNGLPGGLEIEPDTESDINEDIRIPFDPKEIDVITQQRTVGLLMERLEHGEMDLSPDFQRRANLWKDWQKSGLIESMLLRIPIPSLYVSEDENGIYTVVDGLQRLCAIAHFVKVSSLNKTLGTKLNPLRLSQLQSLGNNLDNTSFDELPRPLQRRINETELTLHIIRAGTPTNVKFNIFSRINQSGLPLKAQEIRNAIYPGEWRTHIRNLAESEIFTSATEHKIKGERLEDYELILRFVALYSLPEGVVRPLDENLDDFLNNFVEKIANNWNEEKWNEVSNAFSKAMKAAPRIFKQHAFRKYYGPYYSRNPINRGLFETESVVLAHHSVEDLKILENHSDQVLDLLSNKLENDDSFINALLYATGRGSSSNKRIKAMEEIFGEVINAQ